MFALLVCQLANAQTNFFPVLCCSNRIYTNATIGTVTPATVTVFWDGGGERASITNLPPELQTRYHYNPQEAQKYLDAQAAKKAVQKERAKQEAAAFAAVQNTLGPAQKVRVVKTALFPNSLQIEVEGKSSEAYIPGLPPEILTFIDDLNQAQADTLALKERARQVRYNAERAKGIASALTLDNPNYQEQNARANVMLNDARDLENQSADAAKHLRELQAQAKARTTIMARPSGKMLTPLIRQWQFQAMAITDLPDTYSR
jgi:hypothetical protein